MPYEPHPGVDRPGPDLERGTALALMTRDDARPGGRPTADKDVDGRGSPWRVLLVDDRAERRMLVRMVLGTTPPEGRSSVEVVEVSGLSGAAAAAMRRPVDAAVIEVQIADGDGIRTINALKAIRPAPVIVVCTFRADRQMRDRAMEAGADAYLIKPVSHRELLAACQTPRSPARAARDDPASSPPPRPLATEVS